MMDFVYHEPRTVKEALSLLKEFRGDARIKAGGTDLLVKMKQETVNPKHLINLQTTTELGYIDYVPKEELRIGALTTLSEIESSAIIREKFNILVISKFLLKGESI